MVNLALLAKKQRLTVKVSPVIERSPREVAAQISQSVRERRLEQGLTREALALRAGVSADTVKRLEGSGRSTLDTLLRLAFVLGSLGDFERLFASTRPTTLAELETRGTRQARRRGRRRDAGHPRSTLGDDSTPGDS